MNRTDFSDETLMAYADGELDPETTRTLDRMVAEDEALGERIAFFAETRQLARAAGRSSPASTVPDHLRQAVLAMTAASSADGSPPRTKAPKAANTNLAGWTAARAALAASLAAVICGAGGYWLGQVGAPASPLSLAVAEAVGSELAAPLSTIPSGQAAELGGEGARLQLVSSFEVGGHLCREFELARGQGGRSLGVACRRDGIWTTDFALAEAAPAGGDYAPASGADAIEAYLSAVEAGAALPSEEEARRLRGE